MAIIRTLLHQPSVVAAQARVRTRRSAICSGIQLVLASCICNPSTRPHLLVTTETQAPQRAVVQLAQLVPPLRVVVVAQALADELVVPRLPRRSALRPV